MSVSEGIWTPDQSVGGPFSKEDRDAFEKLLILGHEPKGFLKRLSNRYAKSKALRRIKRAFKVEVK